VYIHYQEYVFAWYRFCKMGYAFMKIQYTCS